MKSKKTTSRLGSGLSAWLDTHALFALSLFLLFFIPLYPKIPLAELIPGYLVRVRLEDILVFLTGVVWLIQALRQKIAWKTSFNFLILGYGLVGLLSLSVAIWLQQTIPFQLLHIGKSLLHYFRYLEYFAFFFFVFSGIKTKRQVRIVLVSLGLIVNLIFVYGLGQRYLQWPAFSTMNREYSKGQSLVLSPDIKLHSTFGGHYDLAAYLVITLPLITALLLKEKKKWQRVWLGLTLLGGGWLLLESASKTALAACLLALGIVVWENLTEKWGQKKATLWSLLSGGALFFVAIFGLYLFKKPTLYRLAPFLRPAGIATPIDVEPVLDETWSENARRYGLSMGIRLDTLWPNALRGFATNPYIGQGYATLNKAGINEFTQADSTDNNFLRILGETGLLGLIAFLGVVILIIKTLWLKKSTTNQTIQVLRMGFTAASIGLLVNALIIDVFAASKVAFTYWALSGLAVKSFALEYPKVFQKEERRRWQNFKNWLRKEWPLLVASGTLILLSHQRPLTEYSLVKSFALNPQSAQHVATTKCLWESKAGAGGYGTGACFQNFNPWGLPYSLTLLSFYTFFPQPMVFYFLNLILLGGSLVLLNQILEKIWGEQRLNQFLSLLVIVIWPGFYQLPAQASPLNLYLFLGLLLGTKFINKKRFSTLTLNSIFLWSLLIIELIYLQLQIKPLSQLTKNWRDLNRPHSFVAIRQANRFLGPVGEREELKNNQVPQPILISAIQPVLFQLYGEKDQEELKYQLWPLSQDKLSKVKTLLTTHPEQKIFLTNANTNLSPQTKAAFEDYKQNLGITLRQTECRQGCNYYQLLAEEIQIPTQAQTWSQAPWPSVGENETNRGEQEPQLLVLDEAIIQALGTASPYAPQQLALRDFLLDQESDLIFISGDKRTDILKNHGPSFLKRIGPSLQAPIIAVPSYSQAAKHTWPSPQYQRFALNDQTWIVTLDSPGNPDSPQQKIFLFDTLLQLEKHPQVKQVYFVTADDTWLQPVEGNHYFSQDFVKELEKFAGKVEFEFLYPQEFLRLNLP